MGWLSDRQIKMRCIKPTHYLRSNDNKRWDVVIAGVTHTQEQIDNWEARCYSRLLTITRDSQLEGLGWSPMIDPFFPEAVSEVNGNSVPSFGLSSFGYDIRMAAKDVKVFSNIQSKIIDPLNLDPACYVAADIHTDHLGRKYYIQPPTSLALGHTPETFDVPRDILVTALGKSTYARAGISVVVTPLEPEWKGQLVVEVVNHTTSPCKIYLESGIAQLLFGKGDEECEVSYKDRKGKYQDQTGTQDSLAARKVP